MARSLHILAMWPLASGGRPGEAWHMGNNAMRARRMGNNAMRAIGQDTFGGPEVLRVTTVDRPVPGTSEVLVKVHATGVNPTDLWHRATGGLLGTTVRL